MARFSRYHEEWGICDTCSFDVPVSLLIYNTKYGWQCTGYPGANCFDSRPDREDYEAKLRFPPNEGVRQSHAPQVNPNEGISDEAESLGYGLGPYGEEPYGE